MKKFIMVLFLIVAMMLCTGCMERKEAQQLTLSDPNETVVTETVTWENVEIEGWG